MSSPAVAIPHRRRHLRAVPVPPLRVADVALFYGGRSGGIRTYLDEKAAYAAGTGAFEHHLIVPGRRRRSEGRRHELPSVSVAGSNGYRWPLGARALAETLRRVRPDVVLLHDPFWHPHETTEVAHRLGAAVVMVHHGSVDLNAHAFPGPTGLYARAFRAWLRRAYEPADAVMAACDPWPDCGRSVTAPLRFGLHPAFRPQPNIARRDHVLYVGRLGREKGIFELLEAAARSREPWPLELIGADTAGGAPARPLLALWRGGGSPRLAPALSLGTASPAKRALSPTLVRAGAVGAGRVLRLDLHPGDFEHWRHARAVESVL